MTATNKGSRGEPIIQNPPTRIPDLTAIAEYAATNGNRISDTASNRTAFSANFGYSPYDGLTYFEIDTGTTWVYYGAWRVQARRWTAFNPTFVNLAGVTAAGEYTRNDGQTFFSGQAELLSNSSVGGSIGMTLPVDRHGFALPGGEMYAVDASAPAGQGLHRLYPVLTSANTVNLYWLPATSAPIVTTSATAPFPWARGDRILWDIRYASD